MGRVETEAAGRQKALHGEAATAAFARHLAPHLRAGDLVLLSGEIGAGKSVLARALIRALLAEPFAEVPSPSYTLVQTYEAPDFDIVHADLYRLTDAGEAEELGLDAALEAGSVVLVEWPERAGPWPESALHLALKAGSPAHLLSVTPGTGWPSRLESLLAAV